MSFPTVEAFAIEAKGWDSALLQHPMMVFLHEHEKLFDAKDYSRDADFYAPDFVYIKKSGEIVSGYEAARKQLQEDYALFTRSFHEPKYGVITAAPGKPAGSYRLFGHAAIFANLAGPPISDDDKKFVDLQGRKWEVTGQGAFIFDVVPAPDSPFGFRFSHFQIFADPTAIIGTALKRGLIPIEALTGH